MSEEQPSATETPALLRVGVLVFILAAVYLAIDVSGLADGATPETIRNLVRSWGAAGVVLYLALFAVGQVFQLPGIIFVVAAGLAYGPWWGFWIAMLGSLLGVSVCFIVARKVGGSPLAQVQRPGVVKLINKLHYHPVRTMILLRMIFGSAPWLSYLLALTAVPYTQYLLGTAIGITVPVFITTWFSDWFLQYLA